jgi:hypothetical protein
MISVSTISPIVIFVCRCIADDSAHRPRREAARGCGFRGIELKEAALFADLIKIDHSAMTELGHGRIMAGRSKMLSSEEFASLLKIANTNAVLEPPALISAEHSARLIGLDYMADLAGRLRMTFAGRHMIAAVENQNRRVPKAVRRHTSICELNEKPGTRPG